MLLETVIKSERARTTKGIFLAFLLLRDYKLVKQDWNKL